MPSPKSSPAPGPSPSSAYLPYAHWAREERDRILWQATQVGHSLSSFDERKLKMLSLAASYDEYNALVATWSGY